MSHINRSSIAKLQQLNCNKGKTTTISAIQDIDASTDIIFLLLQDRWLPISVQPPSSNLYDLLLPPGDSPRCATYVRKDPNLNPKTLASANQSILSILVDIADTIIELINVYAPSGIAANQLLKDHRRYDNSVTSGDLNYHHNLWYLELAAETRIYDLIRKTKTQANELVEYPQQHIFTLQNTPGFFTHFPQGEKYDPTIIDLTWTRGHCSTI